MGDKTGIEWADATWNPVTGCDKVSPGCDHCYAETFAERWRGTEGHYFERGFDVQLRPDKLDLPLRWRKPRRIFVNSMSDLFHDQVPDEYIARVFEVMALAPQHTFQVLTKRHARMRSLVSRGLLDMIDDPNGDVRVKVPRWPLPNVWLGVSAENQQWAKIRGDALRATPAAVRFFSCEPLLGPIDNLDLAGIGWVIVGGESGHGARPMHPDWARSLRDQCLAAGVPFLFKQWGEWRWTREADDYEYERAHGDLYPNAKWETVSPDGVVVADNIPQPGFATMQRVGKKRAGRELDGRTWDQYPEVVR